MKLFKIAAVCALIAGAAAPSSANSRAGMLIDATDINSLTSNQEREAAMFFVQKNSDGKLITVDNISDINTETLDVIWLNFDRVNLGKGNLPGIFGRQDVITALSKFVEDGGNLFVTKMATQMISKIGRIDEAYAPGIFGDGDGGKGTDVWTVNAQIGYMNAPEYNEPDPNREKDETQFYDHRSHELYKDLTVNTDFAAETFALEGTGTGAEMWREDHNCCWDLNAYGYTAEGRNTVEKFEAQNNCTVLGTWGHVIDYAVAGIIEFHAPAQTRAAQEGNRSGVILANGLAAYEWAPREGGNAFHSNIEKMTENALNYLAKNQTTIVELGVDDTASARYYTISGHEVSGESLTPGLYIEFRGNKATKILVK